MKANDLLKEKSILNKGKWKRGNRPELYNRFYGIRARCINPNSNSYNRYGAIGIKCEWKNYEEFESDMLESFKKHVRIYGKKETQIDRIDGNANYSKANCRWATLKEQSNNRKNIKTYEANGKSLTLQKWSEELKVNITTLYCRIYKYKWPLDKVFTSEKRINQFL